MFTLKVENTSNQTLILTQNESNYQVVKVDGLNPPKANIYTSEIANMDGGKFKSSKLEMRNIVLTLKINGDVEANRVHLYEYFKTGAWCKIYYSNDTRNVFIEGYVETVETDLFVINQEIQISIVCPNPYFKSLRAIYADISKVFGAFEFPFEIDKNGIEFSRYDANRETVIVNAGEFSNGVKITLTASGGNVENPVIYNTETYEYLKLNMTINEGEIVVISTTKGSKSVKKNCKRR